MPFEIISRGVYRYNGTIYHEVDCGGGGNCQFLSLAYLLRFHNLDLAATHQLVRGYSAAILTNWVNGLPGWAGQQYEKPTAEVAAKMANNGVWGTITTALAVAVHYNTFHITILGPDTDDVYEVTNHSIPLNSPQIYLFYSGYNHYRALIPAADVHRVPDGMRLDNDTERQPHPKNIFASLKTTSTSSAQNNTTSDSSESCLEIHHINVGQGDCTLIYVKDEFQAIVKSILIDTGETVGHVKAYFDKMIESGDFRPLDIMILSHWDKDHMGAAAAIINADKGKYTQGKNLRIIDLGDPENQDQDAMYFLNEFKDDKRRELPSLYDPLVDDCLGFNLRCYLFNGLTKSTGEGYVLSLKDWKSYPEDNFFPPPKQGFTTQIINARNQYFPSIKNKNDRSIALVVEFHDFTYYTAGDLSDFNEEAVASWLKDNRKHACAWKLGHHGAGEASNGMTLKYLRPRFGVISCGTNNTYGHPSGAALENIEALNAIAECDVYVTTKVPDQASGGKFQPGKITDKKHAHDGHGDIIIKVCSKNADKHVFQVVTSLDTKGTEFKCGARDYDEKQKIQSSTKTSKRKLSQSDIQASEERKKVRMGNTLTTLKEAIKLYIRDASWLEVENVKEAMTRFAKRLITQVDHLDEEKIRENVKKRFSKGAINNAEDVIKRLK